MVYKKTSIFTNTDRKGKKDFHWSKKFYYALSLSECASVLRLYGIIPILYRIWKIDFRSKQSLVPSQIVYNKHCINSDHTYGD